MDNNITLHDKPSILIGLEMSEVVFLKDSLQIDFEAVERINPISWPIIFSSENTELHFGDTEYINAMCSLIMHKVINAQFISPGRLEIVFDNSSRIVIDIM